MWICIAERARGGMQFVWLMHQPMLVFVVAPGVRGGNGLVQMDHGHLKK